MDEEKTYWIVNPAGAIHNVTREHAKNRLKTPGFRLASKEEIAKLQEAGFNQIWDKPICPKWSSEPPEDQELPEPPKVEKPKQAE